MCTDSNENESAVLVTDLLYRDYVADHKFTITTYSSTGVVSVSSSVFIFASAVAYFVGDSDVLLSDDNLLRICVNCLTKLLVDGDFVINDYYLIGLLAED